MIRKCARPYSHLNYWLMQMLGNFGAKQNLYFIYSAPPLCLKNVPAPLGLLALSKVIQFYSNVVLPV